MSRDVDPFFQPIPAMELARFAGVLTFMRLPHMTPDHPRFDDINIGFLGVPWDGGTTNRPDARHRPRQMRDLSTMIRAMNPMTNISPFASVNCADLGDVPPNPVDIQDSLTGVTDFISVMKKKILCQ